MIKNHKILFICHYSDRTGAPLLLLQLIKYIKSSQGCSVNTILLHEGLLVNDFRNLGKILIINSYNKAIINFLRSYFSKIYKLIHNYRIKSFVKQFSPDLVYANTVVSLNIINEIKSNYIGPILCHVHELEYGIDHYLGSSYFRSTIPLIDKFIANSKASMNNLITRYNIATEKIDLVQPHIEILQRSNRQESIYQELSINPETFIIMGCGENNWVKGTDLFIYTASELTKKTNRQFIFVWIGPMYEPSKMQLLYEIDTLGLQNKVKLIGLRNNPLDYFERADVFFMSSRTEPFGMVGLEAASKAIPVICFDSSDGMKEFIGSEAGFVVPYPDYKAVADRILELMDNPELKKKLGQNGQKKALKEANIETTGHKIWCVIEDTIENFKTESV